jgi:ABC-type multidrug transport system ATPase subunit
LGVSRGDRRVLDGVDIDLQPGQITALIGPNGAGKTTLAAVLSGLITPDEGTMHASGRIASALQTPALARRSVLANMRLAHRWWGTPRSVRDQRSMETLRAVGADHLANRRGDRLSGGELRRVHLARVLALEPNILLLDEPFAGLDPATRADLLYDAASALRSSERTTLIVVHDRAEAWALADTVAVLLDGRIATQGTPTQVFERPPTPAVAEFVGFVGRLAEPGGVRYVRASDARLEPSGDIEAVVQRRIPVEDGVRLQLHADAGDLVAIAPAPGPEVGSLVRVTVNGGVLLPDSGEPGHGKATSSSQPGGEQADRE